MQIFRCFWHEKIMSVKSVESVVNGRRVRTPLLFCVYTVTIMTNSPTFKTSSLLGVGEGG